MKKRILILIVSVLALMLCLSACLDNPITTVSVKSVEIVSGSVPTECNVGDTLDFSGIKIKLTYDDNTTKEIGYSDVQISPVDTSTAGEKTVTVTYGAITTEFKVNVKEEAEEDATLTSIKIVAGTVPSALYIGQSFDTSGLQVEANYSDGTKKVLTSAQVEASAVDTATAGEKTFTVTYEGMTDSVTVVVHDITSIKVVSGTVASKLFVGESLDTSNIEVLVTYGDGTSDIITAAGLTVGTLDTSTYGMKTLDVTYNGITIKYDVEVVGEQALNVLAGSVPTSVLVGEAYDASNIKVVLTYSGNSTDPKTLDASDVTVSAIDTSKAGEQLLKVTYNGLETTVIVNVVGVDTLTVVTNTVRSEILKGTALDTSGIKVSVKYTNGKIEVVDASVLTLGTIDKDTAGEQKLTVQYLDKTIEYTVKVCEITSLEIRGVASSVQSGKPIDISEMKVFGVYNDKENTLVELNEGITTNIEELNTTYLNSTEARVLNVSYSGVYGELTGSVTVYTSAPELISIEIENFNKEVLLNNAYDKTSVVVYANYENGTKTKVVGFTMTDVATNVAGDVEFTVTYEGKTATATVKVCKITSLDLVNAPLFAPSGEPIDITGMKVYGVYNDTAKTKIELTDGTITTNIEELNTTYLDSTEPRILTVTYVGMYGEYSTSYTIDTTAPVLESVVLESYVAEIKLGEAYGKDKVQVVAVYGNGQTQTLAADAFSMTPVSTDVAGNVTFTVSFTDANNNITKTASATVKVCEITSLEIRGVASSVQSGKPINISGMQVYGVYNDSAKSEVLLTTGFTTNIDALNANVNGTANRVLVVTYENGAKGTFEISVSAPELSSIVIAGYDKTIGIGGAYNKNSVSIKAVYENGTESIITSGFTVDDVVTSTVGKATLKVTYEGKTASVEIDVVGIASLDVSGINATVNKNAELNTDGVTVTVTFTDGSTRVVGKADGVAVSSPDTTSGGDKQLTVEYLGASTSFAYHVKAVAGIEIYSGLPYIIRTGYAIDYSALKLKITYTNGDEAVVDAAGLAGVTYTGTEVGATSFSVTYEGCTATRQLVEATLYQVHALNGTIPGSILAGNQLDYSKFRITLVYRYYVDGVEKEDLILINIDDPALYWNAGGDYGYVPASYLPTIKVDTGTAGDRIIQFVYMPQMTNEMGIPLYMAQAKVVVVDIAGISIVHGSVPSSVKLNDQYDVSNIIVQVNYTDGTYMYVSLSDLTSVSKLDTSVAGDKTLTATYTGPNGVYTADYTVEVIDTGASVNGIIFGAMLPDSLIARDTYKNNFKDNDNIYVVGDDNPYVLYLNVAVLDKNNKLVDINGQDVPTAVKVYEITNGANTLLEGDALAAVVSFNSAKNSYQFTPAAVGRSFRLEIRPAANYIDEAAVTVKHEIKIVDGYNIYDEKELNLITNGYGDWTGEDLNENLPSLGRLDQGDVAKAFLVANGITADPNAINAVILHRNMSIECEDLPSEYFHTYTKDGVTKTELIDMLEVYQRLVSVEQPFTFYGNYYSIFSYNLPCVVPKNVWNNTDDYSNSTLFSFRLDIRAYWSVDMNAAEIDWPSDNQIANLQDVGFRDNDPNSNDQAASERHMRGLTCLTNKGLTTNVTNVNVDAFVVAMRAEGVNCTINLDQVKFYNCWQGQIFVWNDNGFQLDKWNGEATPTDRALPGIFGTKINITDSLLAKCGGPVILAQSNRANEIANSELSVDVVVDDKSELYSYVTGQEAWFVAVNQTPMAAQIAALDALVKGTASAQGINASYLSDQKIQGVKTMNMVMVVMGAGVIPGEQYSGSFTKGGEVKMQMIKDASSVDPAVGTSPWYYDTYMSIPGIDQAPIFTTSAGGHFFADPYGEVPGSYTINFLGGSTSPEFASGACFQGDYITMHMYGMGIMLEYYH